MRPLLALLLLTAGCAATLPAVQPVDVTEAPALRATRCGDVTAVFRGSTPDSSAPLSFFVDSLMFRFPDGERDFRPTGQVAAPHVSLEVFSPDCAFVALAQDSVGPLHFVKVSELAAYLDGRAAPGIVKSPAGSILTDGRWVSPTRFEFFASCCGGVEVFQADVAFPASPQRVFFAPQAPAGVRRTEKGYEAITSARSPVAP